MKDSAAESLDNAGAPDYSFWMERIEDPPATISIRGHTLLCLQGFKGEGYSPEFVANLSAIHRSLSSFSGERVKVVDRPDRVCSACPHLDPAGCRLNGAGSEEEMKAQDRAVMARLRIAEGEILSWKEILDRIARAVQGSDLPQICGNCRWLPLGYCKEGIDAL